MSIHHYHHHKLSPITRAAMAHNSK